jgi:hypothetical protein
VPVDVDACAYLGDAADKGHLVCLRLWTKSAQSLRRAAVFRLSIWPLVL